MQKTRIKKIASVLLASILSLSLLVGCSAPKPFETVKKFENAFNNLDYNALIDCYDPRVIDMLVGIFGGLGSELSGIDIGDDLIKSLMPSVGNLMSEYANEAYSQENISFHMTAREISTNMIDNENAKVTIEFTIESSVAETSSWQETWSMVLIDGTWYISFGLDDFGLGNLFG